MRIRLALIFVVCAWSCLAQTLSLSGPVTAQPGQTIVLSMSCTGCTGKSIAAFQADVTLNGLTAPSCAAGAALTAGAKATTCNAVAAVYRIVGAGLNTNVLSDGVFATFSGTVPASALGSNLTFAISNTEGAALSGTPPGFLVNALTIAVGTPLSLLVPSPCDLNQDGKVDTLDFGIAIQQALGIVTAITGDLDADGRVDVRDIMRIAVAASGGQCVTGP